MLLFVVSMADTYHIGVSLPLSGKNEAQGKAMLYGLKLCVEEINEKGGINGNELALVVKDDKNDKKSVKDVAQELASDKRVLAIIGHQYSSVSIAAGAVYDKEKVVCISPSASNPKVSQNSEWFFSMNYQDNLQGRFIATYSKAILGSDKVLVIHDEDAYGAGLYKSFSEKAANLGMTFGKLSYSEDGFMESFIADNLKELSKGYTSIALMAHTSVGAKIVKQLRAQGITIPVVGPDAFSKTSFIKALGKDTEEVYVASPFLYELASMKTIKFAETYSAKYKEKYNVEPTLWAAFCYDALTLVANAIEESGADRKAIRDNLAGITKETPRTGITGQLMFDKYGAMEREVVISMIKSGAFKPAFIQLKEITDKVDLNNIDKKVKEDEAVVVDGIAYYKTKVVYAGLDFTRINAVDVPGQNFDIEFYMWFRWMGDLDVENIDFLNGIYGIEDKTEVLRKDFSNPVKYICYKIKGTYLYPYNLRKFPFDIQELPMTMSHKSKTANQVMLVVDKGRLSQAKLETIYPEEWTFLTRKDYSGTFSQQSTFGDPNFDGKTGSVDFSVYETRIVIKRILFPYLINLFLPLLIMIVISLFMFLVPVEQFDARMTLVMTALLSILVFHMAQGESLPNVGYMLRADLYFVISYVLMFVLILSTIYTNLLYNKDKHAFAIKLDKIIGWIFIPLSIISYLVLFLISL